MPDLLFLKSTTGESDGDENLSVRLQKRCKEVVGLRLCLQRRLC